MCRRAGTSCAPRARASPAASRCRSRCAAVRHEQVLVEMRLTFVRESVEVVVPANSPTESLQPVAVSDVLTGAKMDIQPLAGDDFQSLLTVLPSVIRGPEGRLGIKGGGPTTGALQLSSASLNDPSTGDFDLELPGGAVESVEVLSNPFAAEYGRFSTSVTQVRTKRGTNDWVIKPDNLMPGFGKGFGFVSKFEPRLSISGPIKRDRLLFGQYLQYRFVRTPVRSLPGEPQIGVDSFDSFTRLDAVLSSRHSLTGGVIYFPRKITNATLSTFRPEETTPKFTQEGFSAGAVDRLILSAHAVLESTFAVRTFEVDQKTQGELPMTYAPQGQSGNFFNRQERDVLSTAARRGADILEGRVARPACVQGRPRPAALPLRRRQLQPAARRRPPRRLARRAHDATRLRSTDPEVSGTEFAVFAQDRWRVNDRLNFELGIRADRDAVVERVNYSPRIGMSVSVLPEGRGILRGGFGKFAERTPLNVGAFTQYDMQTVSRFAADGTPLGAPITFAHVIDGSLKTPESIVQTVAWDQRLRPAGVRQGRLSASQRIARVHDRSGSGPRRAHARLGRRVQVLGGGDHWPIPRKRTRRRDRVVRPIAQHARSQRLRPVLRQLQEPDHPVERERAQPDRRAQPVDRPRHHRAAGAVGLVAALRMAHRLPVVGGERIPGLRRDRATERAGCRPCRRSTSRSPAVALPEVPFHGRHQGLQRLRLRQRARRAEQHHGARLRQVLQPDPALDRIRPGDEPPLGSRWGTTSSREPPHTEKPRSHERQRCSDEAQQHTHAHFRAQLSGGNSALQKNRPTLNPIAAMSPPTISSRQPTRCGRCRPADKGEAGPDEKPQGPARR